MRIIDELTQHEITNPDMGKGELYEAIWAPPEAYASIDNKTKFALGDDDYEEVLIYHEWTQDDIENNAASAEAESLHEEIRSLPDAVAELSMSVSDGAMDTADLAEALAELSEIVSALAKGENNG